MIRIARGLLFHHGAIMSHRNEALEAAIDELNKHQALFKIRDTKMHHQIMIENCSMIVTVSCAKRDRDNIIAKKVRADIRRAIRMGNV